MSPADPQPRRLMLEAVAGVSAAVLIAVALSLLLSSALAASPARRPAAYVRVDQVGYAPAAPKHAVLLAAGSERGGRFAVIGSRGRVVLSGRLGRRLPSWSRRFGYVYAIDISRLRRPGRYRLRAGGALSPAFAVASPRALFGPLVTATHTFFSAQRDGPDVIPSVLRRRPSHLNDANARVYTAPASPRALAAGRIQPTGASADVSGGWFDAGDYLKFVETGSFADVLVQLAVRDHPSAAALAPDARFETDWLLKMWDPSSRRLLFQVGIGDGDGTHVIGDHDVWRLPQADDALKTAPGGRRYFLAHRPAFLAAPAGQPVSPNLAGRLAAAYGLCAQLYRTSDEALAARCLVAAQTVYESARTSGGALVTSAPSSYYPEREWRDDMELGGTEIYRAMAGGFRPPGLIRQDAAYYLHAAAHWANAYMRSPAADQDSLNLYDVSGVAHPELVAAISDAAATGQVDPADLQASRRELLADMRAQLSAGTRLAGRDPFGAANPFGVSDSVPHALGYAVQARYYRAVAGTTAFERFATTQLDWVLGANAWGSSFLVGAGRVFPHCLQHQVANLAGSLAGHRPLLAGATVDGPNDAADFKGLQRPDGARRCSVARFSRFDGRGARYLDDVASSDSSEPSIDYTSLATLAFAQAADAPSGL